MADTKAQNPSTEQRGLSRRQDYPYTGFLDFNPFGMMRRFSEEMDRAFGVSRGTWGGSWMPAVEVRKQNGNIEVSAELPGLSKDDVKVECTEEGIIIEGEKRREHESEEGGYHRSERSYGHFYRLIPLPEGAATDKAKADFKNGILQVTVPVNEKQQPKSRQIPINS